MSDQNEFDSFLSEASNEEIKLELARRSGEPYVPPNPVNDGHGDDPDTEEAIAALEEAAKPKELYAPELSYEELSEQTEAIYAEYPPDSLEAAERVNALTRPVVQQETVVHDTRPRHEVEADVERMARESSSPDELLAKLTEAGMVADSQRGLY